MEPGPGAERRRLLVDLPPAVEAGVADRPALSAEPAELAHRLAQHRHLDRRRGGRRHWR